MAQQEIKPGSKLDKAVKLLKAQRAIADLAPQGGLTMDRALFVMHDELERRFNYLAETIGITEHALLMLCKTALGE